MNTVFTTDDIPPTGSAGDDEWLTVGEAAHALQLSERRIRVLADSGVLEMRREKYGRMIRRSSVTQYAQSPRTPGRRRKE